MQCKVTCFTIAVDCSDYDYVCFALLRMSLKVFADCPHKRNSRIRLYGDDGFDYVEAQIDFTVKTFAAVALCTVPAIRSSYAEQAFPGNAPSSLSPFRSSSVCPIVVVMAIVTKQELPELFLRYLPAETSVLIVLAAAIGFTNMRNLQVHPAPETRSGAEVSIRP